MIDDEAVIAINDLIFENQEITLAEIKEELGLDASIRTIGRYVNALGWRKIETKYRIYKLIFNDNKIKKFINIMLFDFLKDIVSWLVEKTQSSVFFIRYVVNYLKRRLMM